MTQTAATGRRLVVGARLLLIATVAAMLWANLAGLAYEGFWTTPVTVGVAGASATFTLHAVVNDALMTIAFLSVGLEVRREFATGRLSTVHRALLPMVATVAGLAVPAIVFLAVGGGTEHPTAWAVVISTDTVFLLGALALVGPPRQARLRIFLTALVVLDGVGALVIIAVFYTETFDPTPLLVAIPALVGIREVDRLPGGHAIAYLALGTVVWGALLVSGAHATLAGAAIALVLPLRPRGTAVASPNERSHALVAPYVAYVILPLFALANAGAIVDAAAIDAAASSPLTWGIIAGLLAGKFLGVFGASAALRALDPQSPARDLSFRSLAGGSALTGIGFTISLFIVSMAIDDPDAQNEARLGVVTASLAALLLATAIFHIGQRPRTRKDVSWTRSMAST